MVVGGRVRGIGRALLFVAAVGLVMRLLLALMPLRMLPFVAFVPALVECDVMAQWKTRVALPGHAAACGRFVQPPFHGDPTGGNCRTIMGIKATGPSLDRMEQAAHNVLASPPLPPWHIGYRETVVETSAEPILAGGCDAAAGRVVTGTPWPTRTPAPVTTAAPFVVPTRAYP